MTDDNLFPKPMDMPVSSARPEDYTTPKKGYDPDETGLILVDGGWKVKIHDDYTLLYFDGIHQDGLTKEDVPPERRVELCRRCAALHNPFRRDCWVCGNYTLVGFYDCIADGQSECLNCGYWFNLDDGECVQGQSPLEEVNEARQVYHLPPLTALPVIGHPVKSHGWGWVDHQEKPQ